MKITDATVTPLAVPRQSALTTSYGAGKDAAETVLVQLHTDEGLVGIGQTSVDAPYYGESMEGIVTNIRKHFAPALIGEDPLNIEYLNQKFKSTLSGHLNSQSAVELALWDLKGKALGVPVYQLLGGRVRPGTPLMGFVTHGEPQAMAEDANRVLAETPYSMLKMKVGMEPAEDIARYQAVAEAVAGRALIQVDGNRGYTLPEALPTLTTMQEIGGLGAIEQPVAALSDMKELSRRLSIPLMSDESIFVLEDAMAVIRERAAMLALMKVTKHGGILTVQKIAALFDAAGLGLSIAIYYDLIGVATAHLSAALPCATWPSPATPLEDTILTQPFEPDGLVLRPPEGPGFGVDLDPEKVEKYTVDL